MKGLVKILSIIIILSAIGLMSFADKGGSGKKRRTQLNIQTTQNLKSSIRLDINSGMTYKGSFLTNTEQVGNILVNDAMVLFKKGNTTYILPYKQKIFIPSYSQAEGYKLIIRTR